MVYPDHKGQVEQKERLVLVELVVPLGLLVPLEFLDQLELRDQKDHMVQLVRRENQA